MGGTATLTGGPITIADISQLQELGTGTILLNGVGLVTSGSTATFTGTTGPDTFAFNAGAPATH